MPLYGKKTLLFPNDSESYMTLARRSAKKGELARAIQLCCRGDEFEHDKKHVLFIADILNRAQMYEKSNEYIVRNFPNAQTRPNAAWEIMRMNFSALYEYSQERKVIHILAERGEKTFPPMVDAQIDSILEEAGLMLNDTMTYGCDLSVLDQTMFVEKSIMAVCGVLRSEIDMINGDYTSVIEHFKGCLDIIFHQYSAILPEKQLLDNIGLYLMACVLNGEAADALEAIKKLKRKNLLPEGSRVFLCAYAFILQLTGEDTNALDTIAQVQMTSIAESICMARAYMFLNEYKNALPYAKTVREAFPYMVGANHIYGACLYENEDYSLAYSCYERIANMLPDDINSQYYKKCCQIAVKAQKSGAQFEKQHFPDTYTTAIEHAFKYTEKIAEHVRKPSAELKYVLENNADLCNEIAQIVPFLTEESQSIVVNALISADANENLLRALLLKNELIHKAKESIVKHIRKKGDEKIAVGYGNVLFEGYPYAMRNISDDSAVCEAYLNSYKIAKVHHGVICTIALNDLYEYYLAISNGFADEDESMVNAFAVCIHLKAALKGCFEEDLNSILTLYPNVDRDDALEAMGELEEIERRYIYDLFGNV